MSKTDLDTSTGRPAAGVCVALARQESGTWLDVATATTEAEGRMAEFPANEPALSTGSYRLAFDVEGYSGGRLVDSFFNYTAVMATAVTPGEVIGVEIDAALGSQPRANLMGVEHVT